MFEVGQTYANRMGKYTVLEIHDPKMKVRYEDGQEAELNIHIQYRIWENIVTEEEIKSSRASRARRSSTELGTKFYVRPVDSQTAESLSMRGWKDHVAISEAAGLKLSQGDRIIYYMSEGQVFFAVVTITGDPTEPTVREKAINKRYEQEVLLFPVDVDARAWKIETAVGSDAVEFESQPDMKRLLSHNDIYIAITEDEFELLAELLTEATEEDDEDEVEIEDEEEEYEE